MLARLAEHRPAGRTRKDSGPMYARVTQFQVDPSRLPELSAKIKEMGPLAKALQGVIVAIYESKAAADRAVMRIQALWGDLVNLLSGAPRTDVYAHAEHITG